MSVVLRCPTCGTTRPTPGECEACHETQVRYFCTNHTPGLWVDAPTCPQCGARLGEPRRVPTPAPVPPVRTRAPTPTRAPAWTPPPPPPYSRTEPTSVRGEWEARERLPPDREEGLAPGSSPIALLLSLLNAGARARRTAPVAAPDRARPGIGRGVFGCLIQIVLAFFALVSALFLFGW